MAEVQFKDFFISQLVAPTDHIQDGDKLLLLRGTSIFKVAAIGDTAYATFADNTLVTTINTIDVYEDINGALGGAVFTNNFTFAANAFTFTGPNQVTPSLLAGVVAGIKMGVAGFNRAEVGIFVNGIQQGTSVGASMGDTERAFVACRIVYALQQNDVITMKVRNRDGDSDLTIEAAELFIR